jgi:hydroxymethylbilane synthase
LGTVGGTRGVVQLAIPEGLLVWMVDETYTDNNTIDHPGHGLALPIDACVPSPGQGAIAIEVRTEDRATRETVARVNDRLTGLAVEAERAMVAALGGGCQTPIGAVAVADGGTLDLHAVVVSIDGQHAVRGRDRAPLEEAATLGQRVARMLIEEGAGCILEEVRRAQAPTEGIQP